MKIAPKRVIKCKEWQNNIQLKFQKDKKHQKCFGRETNREDPLNLTEYLLPRRTCCNYTLLNEIIDYDVLDYPEEILNAEMGMEVIITLNGSQKAYKNRSFKH